MMKKRLVIVVIVLASVGVVGMKLLRMKNGADSDAIRLSGNIEITSSQVSFNIAGRVVQRVVSEGESVTNGQVVAILDGTELELELGMRRADAEAAHAALTELETGTRPEDVEGAEAALEVAKAESVRVTGDFARQNELFQQKVISRREFEAAEAAFNVASAKVREAMARLALLKKGPREETILAARARLEQARQADALADARLGYATLSSPLTGVVLTEGVESGEYVVPGTPVVTVGDLVNVWLRAYVNEKDMGRVKIGQPVTITADSYPEKVYEGRLSFISSEAEFTPKNVQTTEERVKLVYRVKVDIANTDQELKPGMPADAEIKIR